ncbi:microtubule-associated protein TORTIFOLIA1-like isoform X2 [Bidens hawaiensis]|uniref:microtubule-associated protein TORTIFOLIA1-like isoform X2 n=1 Tax=Bidens hawaiensis TaxID=980011 RepID=UPI00404AD93D
MATTKLKSRKHPSTTPPNPSKPSSLSSHIELKNRILNSLSKLSDRDTHQIAIEDLEKTIQTLTPDTLTILLNPLFDASSDPNKPAAKKESIRLLHTLSAAHTDAAAPHLVKIITHIVKRLKDSDSGVRDACREAIGELSGLYLKGEGENVGAVVSVFVKPLFEALNDQSKGVQAGGAMCLARMVEMASDPPVFAFQKMCGRICKYLNNSNFLAKAALLQVVSSLSQVGAISPQGLEPLLQSIHDCLTNSDWAARKAAADALTALALHSTNLITGKTGPTITALEDCRFDKIKPARDSINEALQHWQRLAGGSEDQKAQDGEASEPAKSDKRKPEGPPKNDEPEGTNIPEKAVGILIKKAPALCDKELNPEFFQRLEKRVSGEVEVVVPRRFVKSSNEQNGDESGLNETDVGSQSKEGYQKVDRGIGGPSRRQEIEDVNESSQREGFRSNKGNWLAIQRQLLQLERQQAHLMNMLQDFMGGSHDGMMTLENRVRGLERVVEDMARDLSLSANNRRGGNYKMGFEEPGRPLGKYNGFSDYPNTKLGRNDDPMSYMGSSMRGRGSSRRSDGPENWDYHSYNRNPQMGLRRGMDGWSPKSEPETEPVRRGWGDKGVGPGAGPARFGEGPSARSVWQASKDEATLEAIRGVSGEDNGPARTARVAVPEMTAEAMGDENVQDRDPVWTAWSNAMDAVHVGDADTAFAEVLSTGDDLLLVKLMDRTGPVIDQLSSEVGTEVLHAVAQFLPDQNVFDICLSWLQQLLDMIVENGTDNVGIPMELKREILVNLNEAASTIEPPDDWEGMVPDQLLLQLASAWDIDLQQLDR